MADLILHITSRSEWEAARRAGAYSSKGFVTDGFIHCSTPDQVLAPANSLFRGQKELVLLCIDPAKVGHEIRYENLDGGGDLFPHIYGALPPEAVIAAID